MKKKIIFFLQNFHAGGAERNLINYANYLVVRNIDVYIAVISDKGILKKNLNKNIKILNLNKKRLLFSIIKIINIIKIIKPDYLFSSLLHISLLLSFLKRHEFINSKLLIRPSNIIFNNLNSDHFLKKSIFKFLTKHYLKYGDLYLSISKEIYKSLIFLKINKKKIIKINNAIIDNNFYKKSKETLRNKKFQKSDYILSIGRLTKQKNHLMLIKAFSLIKKKYKKKIFLLIIGEGPLKKKLLIEIKSRNIQDSVFILNNKPNVKNFINQSKLFVQTSLWEGQPNVLLEAIILNKQVIATKCPGQSHHNLSKFKNCYLLKKNSIINLSKIILFFLKKNKIYNFPQNKYKQYKVENSAKKILNAIRKN